MRMHYLLIVFIAAVSLAGCKKPVPVETANICSPDNEKKYVVTSGFHDDRGSIFCSNIGGGSVRCGLDVVGKAGDKRIFGADVEQGSGANQIEKLESGYKSGDVKVRDSTGAIVKLSDKVTLTGEMSISPDSTVCFMKVDKIEK